MGCFNKHSYKKPEELSSWVSGQKFRKKHRFWKQAWLHNTKLLPMSRQRLRPTKRPHTDHTYYDSVPLPKDFDFVYSSEADIWRPGHVNWTEHSSQPTAVNSWNSAATWVTPDDPDSQWYNEAVEADLGEQWERWYDWHLARAEHPCT